MNDDKTVQSSWRRIRLVVLGYLLMYPLPWIGHPPSALGLLASALGIGVFVLLYFRGYGTQNWWRLGYAAVFLAIGFALRPFGGLWTVFAVYACSMAGFSRPLRIAAVGLVAILALFAALSWLLGVPWEDWVFGELIGAIIGMCCIFVATINERNQALADSREQVRQLAMVAERERIARDLHDVLGHTLTLIAVKADLARKLIERDPGAARREIEEIHHSARTALADVRAALSGVRSTTLAAELEQARRSLESAGIAFAAIAPSAPLPPRIDVALGYVLREATTNVIRHSAARNCRIALSQDCEVVQLQVRDDGKGASCTPGNGVTGMQQRLAAVGGTFKMSGVDEAGAGGTLVLARVPLAQDPP